MQKVDVELGSVRQAAPAWSGVGPTRFEAAQPGEVEVRRGPGRCSMRLLMRRTSSRVAASVEGISGDAKGRGGTGGGDPVDRRGGGGEAAFHGGAGISCRERKR